MNETFITFHEGPPKPKTRTWQVRAKQGGVLLGEIRRFGRWRCYAFEPWLNTVFEHRCLRDIADFCEHQTNIQRQTRKQTETVTHGAAHGN